MPSQTLSDAVVANANIGISNIIEEDVLIKEMIRTFTELAEKLKAHCGPYSGTAILTNPTQLYQEPIFTKDGINIVKSIQYVSPLQDFVRRQMAYIGSRVESNAGDGTTSSMIITAYTLAAMLEKMQAMPHVYSQTEIRLAWNKLVSMVEDAYSLIRKKQVECTDTNLIRHWARSQAYTSSHGDKELSECIGDLFASTPRDVWKSLTIQRANFESNERFKIMKEDCEFSLDNVTIYPNSACTSELGTVYEMGDVVLVVTDSLNIADEDNKFIFEQVSRLNDLKVHASEDLRPMAVVVQNPLDMTTMRWLDEHTKYTYGNFAVFVAQSRYDSAFNDVEGLKVLVDSLTYGNSKESGFYTAYHTSLRFKGSRLVINNLYPSEMIREDGLSQLYLSQDGYATMSVHYGMDIKPYVEYLKALQRIIEKEKENDMAKSKDALRSFIRLYHKLITTRNVQFIVGGSSYDNAANVDIAIDVMKGTTSSLLFGFTKGRCLTLEETLKVIRETQSVDKDKTSMLITAFCDALIGGIVQVKNAVATSFKNSRDMDTCLKYNDTMVDFTQIIDNPSYRPPTGFEDTSSYLIIQPMECDLSFLRRFGEAGLKFLTAKRVIMDGYVYDKSHDKGE